MTIRKILTEPDPILKKISSPVEVVGAEEQKWKTILKVATI